MNKSKRDILIALMISIIILTAGGVMMNQVKRNHENK